jgi:hypothetical protein
MPTASAQLLAEIRRQISWLQAVLDAWPSGEGSRAARGELVRELENRLGLLALLAGETTAQA